MYYKVVIINTREKCTLNFYVLQKQCENLSLENQKLQYEFELLKENFSVVLKKNASLQKNFQKLCEMKN